MPIFPTGYTDRVPSRSSKVYGDDGVNNCNFAMGDILDLFQLSDLPPGVAAGDFPQWNGTQWVFGNPLDIGEMTAASAAGDTNRFAVDQGGAAPVRMTMSQLFDYMLAKMRASNAEIEDVASSITAYTFVAADRNKIKRFNATAASTISLPAGMAVGTTFGWLIQGTGVHTFQSVTNAGQTLQSPAGLKSAGQYARGSAVCVAANTWNISGFTTP
jgi:hypothetical protein